MEFFEFFKKKPLKVMHSASLIGEGTSEKYIVDFDVQNSV